MACEHLHLQWFLYFFSQPGEFGGVNIHTCRGPFTLVVFLSKCERQVLNARPFTLGLWPFMHTEIKIQILCILCCDFSSLLNFGRSKPYYGERLERGRDSSSSSLLFFGDGEAIVIIF